MKEKQTKPKKKKVRDEQELESEKLKQYKELVKSIPDPTPWERFGINE